MFKKLAPGSATCVPTQNLYFATGTGTEDRSTLFPKRDSVPQIRNLNLGVIFLDTWMIFNKVLEVGGAGPLETRHSTYTGPLFWNCAAHSKAENRLVEIRILPPGVPLYSGTLFCQ